MLVQLDVSNYHIEKDGKLKPLINDKISVTSTPTIEFPYEKLKEEVNEGIQSKSGDHTFDFYIGDLTLTNPDTQDVKGSLNCLITMRAAGIWITNDSIIIAGPQPNVSAHLTFEAYDGRFVQSFTPVLNAKVNSKVLSTLFGYSKDMEASYTYYLEDQSLVLQHFLYG